MREISWIFVALSLIGVAKGQTTVNFTAPATEDPGTAAVFTCEYTLDAGTPLDKITIQRQVSGAYSDVLTYNETDQLIYGNTGRYSGSAGAGSFEFTIDRTLEADEGNYKCVIIGSSSSSGKIAAFAVNNINACLDEPCKNGGTCADGIDTFTCTCLSCYNDATCETQAVNECDAKPCKNNGVCTDGCDSFSCDCPFGYGGDTCTTVCDGIKNVTAPVETTLGSMVTLTCTPSGEFDSATTRSVYWSMGEDGTPVRSGKNTYTFRASTALAGTHYCFVNVDGCYTRRSTTVSVTYELSPNTTTTENVTMKERDDKTLSCSATGQPTPMLRWMFVPLPDEPMERDNMPEDENGTMTTPEAPMSTTRPEPIPISNATANETTYTIRRARPRDAGHYICVADQGEGSVMTPIKDFNIRVEPFKSGSGLENWEIALIVIGCVLFVVLLIAVIFLILWKTGKAGSICPQDKVGAAENGKSPYEKRPDSRMQKSKLRTDENDDSDADENVLPPSPKPKSKKRVLKKRYDDSSPRPLPEAPGARGGTLPPLDLEAEKSKKKKKKPKRRKAEAEDDSGNEDF